MFGGGGAYKAVVDGCMGVWIICDLFFIAVQMGEEPPPNLIPSLRVLSSAAGSGVPDSNLSSILAADNTLPGPSSEDRLELVYITDGLPPVTRKLYDKIQAWQYINLLDLSPKSIKKREEESHFLQQCDGKVLLVHTLDNVKRKSAEFPDIVSWTEAFATLVAVVGKKETSHVPELMAYIAKVIRAARVREPMAGVRSCIPEKGRSKE